MTGAPAATLVRSTARVAKEVRPKGLGGGGLSSTGLTPCGGHAHLTGPNLRRQWTLAKNTRDVQCNVLPVVLDIALGLFDTLDLMKSSVDSEVVFQATLQVPAHHALACRMQAYGTPFAAPDLQAAAGDLADADLEFAACIAAPPDLDEQMSMNIGRVMSMLEQNRAEAAGAVARAGAPTQQAQQASGGGSAQVTPGAQAMRGTPQQVQQQAPKVLVSVDDAEAGTAQMQRTNSMKKQPKFMSLAEGYGKRAMQALLGFGYLLTVLHEKHLGGHIEFSAAALTATVSTTPNPSGGGGHVRQHQQRSSRGGGLLANLKQMVQECPSLSPMASFGRRELHHLQRRISTSSSGGAAAETIAEDADFYMQQQQQPATPMSPGMGQAPSFDMVWERISSPTPQSGPVHGLALQLSLSAPLRTSHSSSLERAMEEEVGVFPIMTSGSSSAAQNSSGGGGGSSAVDREQEQQQQQLSKVPDMGRSGSMERLLDEALVQLAALEPAAAAAVVGIEAPKAAASPAAPTASADRMLESSSSDSLSSRTMTTPFQKVQLRFASATAAGEAPAAASAAAAAAGTGTAAESAAAPRSHFLPDQDNLTSPLPNINIAAKPWAAAWLNPNQPSPSPSPGLPPLSPMGRRRQQQQQGVGIGMPPLPNGAASPAAAAAAAAGVTPQGSPLREGLNGLSNNTLMSSPRILRPMMSMRLTCQPNWQFNNALEVPDNNSGGGSKSSNSSRSKLQQQQQENRQEKQQEKRTSVNVHSGSEAGVAPSGLWPTLSFGLVPVRILPSAQQPQPA